jgi:23S rRNA (adenine2030-N6)-methyltransferase
LLPPKERRGLVLIDPPFEKNDEFGALANGLAIGWQRFAAGVFLAWYPLKDRAAAERFHRAVVEAGIRDATIYELYVRAPESAPGLAGSGLLAVNASYALDGPMREALPYLAVLLGQGPGARWRAERLTRE